jgi:uncharacterized protein YcfJ
MKIISGIVAVSSAIVLSSTLSGCGTSAGVKGAGVGALGGYVAGRATGSHSDERARKGALLGAIGGYVVGNEMDKRNNTNNYQTHQHPGGNTYHTHQNGVSHSH